MPEPPRLWIRHETRQTERRAPLVPDDARHLVKHGIAVTVEESHQRAFATSAYAEAGCRVVPAGSWMTAPDDEIVLGLKELPDIPAKLTHRHVYFGHAFKGQEGARALLARFAAGGGALLDIEYLLDDDGRRLAAFGYWAGYVGAALAVLELRGRLSVPLHPLTQEELDRQLQPRPGDPAVRALVVGGLGRCGRGARAAFVAAGIEPTCWDLAETRELDHDALIKHDILVNAVLATEPAPPLLTHDIIDVDNRRLSVICDVTCDVTSPCNMLPIYERVTSWPKPVLALRSGQRPLRLIAIDNLPSLLPREASLAFSAELARQLVLLGTDAPVWHRCLQRFQEACRRVGVERGPIDE